MGRRQYDRYDVPQSVQSFGALQAPERIQGVWDAARAQGIGVELLALESEGADA